MHISIPIFITQNPSFLHSTPSHLLGFFTFIPQRVWLTGGERLTEGCEANFGAKAALLCKVKTSKGYSPNRFNGWHCLNDYKILHNDSSAIQQSVLIRAQRKITFSTWTTVCKLLWGLQSTLIGFLHAKSLFRCYCDQIWQASFLKNRWLSVVCYAVFTGKTNLFHFTSLYIMLSVYCSLLLLLDTTVTNNAAGNYVAKYARVRVMD